MTGPLGAFWAVFAREVRAASRSWTYALLAAVVTFVVFGVARAGNGPSAGYVPTVVDVLLVVEVLVPAVAFAVGYRAVADDAERGRLDVFATYPLPASAYVGGVYAGRAVALLGVVVAPLAVLGLHVATTAAPATTVFATHRGVDSPLLFVRFLALTAAFALVALAIAVALSAAAGSRRRAILLALVGLLVVVVGADVTVFGAMAGDTGIGLGSLLALSPSSAYRGLVFETVLYVAFTGRSAFVSTSAAVTSLVVWGLASLLAATLAIRWRRR
ncbi:ABC transporter permease subunit [Haloplanus pelagicus]|uniref:ABC transporter permease subunit n=1 Tax=Haloplanus pelagicus TaxID=2949995 RepID=UPI00203D1DA4|nr:ABC transporter permease subunit [Haloplanus sp. HW8-1]